MKATEELLRELPVILVVVETVRTSSILQQFFSSSENGYIACMQLLSCSLKEDFSVTGLRVDSFEK